MPDGSGSHFSLYTPCHRPVHGRIVAYGAGLPGGRKVMEQARALLVE